MIGAAFLAGAARITENNEYSEVARQAMEYSCTRQLADGSWYYGEDPIFHWIDVFHTGYNLDSLRRYITYTGDVTFDSHLRKGLKYFKANFVEPTGRVKYYFDRAFPIDIQCASQAIDTLSLFSDLDPGCLSLAENSACWYIEHMQDDDGHFYFRKYPLGIYKSAEDTLGASDNV